jgi:hypothetical protein
LRDLVPAMAMFGHRRIQRVAALNAARFSLNALRFECNPTGSNCGRRDPFPNPQADLCCAAACLYPSAPRHGRARQGYVGICSSNALHPHPQEPLSLLMLADNDAVRIPDQAPAVVGKGSGEGGPTLLCAARVPDPAAQDHVLPTRRGVDPRCTSS